MNITVFNQSKNELPSYGTPFSSGVDLVANVPGLNRIMVYPGHRVLIPTGLFVAIPDGYEIQIRPRSGLALKKGITVLNTPGTIDSDYRGEIGVIIINHGLEAVGFGNGDKIAQAVLTKVEKIEWITADSKENLPVSIRGEGGFGSTDKKDSVS